MAITQDVKDRWNLIDGIVKDNKKELKAAETHEPLKAFADEQGWDNGSDFAQFKRSLLKIGVNYDKRREVGMQRQKAARAEQIKKIEENSDDVASVLLFSGAVEGEDGSGAFAVVNDEDEPIWYGKFFDDDRIRTAGDLISAEQSAANKAVWLASKALEAAGHDCGRVIITTTCHELDEHKLKEDGARFSMAVDVLVDPDDERAVDVASAPGFKKWQDNDLSELVEEQ